MQRISLRKIRPDDNKYFQKWWRSKKLIALTSGNFNLITDKEVEKYFCNMLKSKTDYHFMIVLDKQIIGHISLNKRKNIGYETQIIIGDNKYWGKGYGVKAIRLLLDKAEKIGAHKIYLEIRPENTRAIKVYERIGFETKGIKKYPLNPYQPETIKMVYNVIIQNKLMQANFKIRVDIRRDARNIWQACNKVSHGMDWKKRAEPNVYKHVVGKTQKQAFKWLLPYLKKLYKDIDLKSVARKMERDLDVEFPKIISVLEEITQKPIYRKDFTLFLTTFPRCPYNFDKGYIWVFYKDGKSRTINTLLHEILHFQFMQYYGKKVWKKVGSDVKWQAIKEGMVVILNDYTPKWTGIKEITYTMYEKFAKDLLKLWKGSANRNFKKFIDGAIELVEKYNF